MGELKPSIERLQLTARQLGDEFLQWNELVLGHANRSERDDMKRDGHAVISNVGSHYAYQAGPHVSTVANYVAAGTRGLSWICGHVC